MQKKIFLFLFLQVLFSICILAQPKKKKNTDTKPVETYELNSFEISLKGDTINKLVNKKKQGYWVEQFLEKNDEKAFYEIGNYNDNYKTGNWKKYEMNGILLADENYKLGKLDGDAKYYENGYLSYTGKYLALRSGVKYDTIEVEDPVTELKKTMVIDTKAGSVKNGTWTFFEVPFSKIIRVMEFAADDLIYDKDYTIKEDSLLKTNLKPTVQQMEKKQVVLPFQDLNKNKKAPRFTDFPENGKGVKPNPGKKRYR